MAPTTVVRLAAAPRVLQSIRGAINARAAELGAPPAARHRAVSIALGELRDGASSGWAIQAGVRSLRGLPAITRPAGAHR